jgi:hypothetical protein
VGDVADDEDADDIAGTDIIEPNISIPHMTLAAYEDPQFAMSIWVTAWPAFNRTEVRNGVHAPE